MNQKTRTMWDYIKEIYLENHGITPDVVDYIAIFDIAKASCSGISNEDIAHIYGMELSYVKGVLVEFLNFVGWTVTLDISPFLVYNRVSGNKELFFSSLMAVSSLIGRQNIEKAYDICQTLEYIKKEIENNYG